MQKKSANHKKVPKELAKMDVQVRRPDENFVRKVANAA